MLGSSLQDEVQITEAGWQELHHHCNRTSKCYTSYRNPTFTREEIKETEEEKQNSTKPVDTKEHVPISSI